MPGVRTEHPGREVRVVALTNEQISKLQDLENDQKDFMRRYEAARNSYEKVLAEFAGPLTKNAGYEPTYELDSSGTHIIIVE